jgi:hypothetical protein
MQLSCDYHATSHQFIMTNVTWNFQKMTNATWHFQKN